MTFFQLLPIKRLKLACFAPILRLKEEVRLEEQVIHIHMNRLAFLYPPTLKKGSQKVNKTISKLHNCPRGLFIIRKKENILMNTSTSSDNNNKKSQVNIKRHWKKIIYLYLNNFYKYSLHSTDPQFHLSQFHRVFLSFCGDETMNIVWSSLNASAFNITFHSPKSIHYSLISAHKLKYKNPTT